jgi:formylglycine-generating enzyme required for sulfatase activity
MNFEIAPKSTEKQLTWDEANSYCSKLNIDGKTGWRLPTKEELDLIYHSENDFVRNFYWSSTENNGDYAWCQHFDGGVQYFGVNKAYPFSYVRPVRDL